MSLFWRKAFTWSEGGVPPVLHTFYAMMKRISTKLAYLCGCCPCHQWYIAALCPCGECVSPDPCFLGDPVIIESLPVTADYGDGSYEIMAVTYEDSAAQELDESGHTAIQTNCVGAGLGCIVWAIRHLTREAPAYAGNVHALVYLDGEEIKAWSAPYTPEESSYIGEGIDGESVSTELLDVKAVFADGGNHNLDLMVKFIGNNGEHPVAYTLRKTFQIHEQPESVEWIGQPFVAPDYAIDGEEYHSCKYLGNVDPWLTDIAMQIIVLKGPFNEKAEADYVLENWNDFIAEYARTCACVNECAADYFIGDNVEEGGLIVDPGGTEDGSSGVFCEVGYTEWQGRTSADTEFRLYDTAGRLVWTYKSEFYPPDSYLLVYGVVPPCWQLSMHYTGDPENYENDMISGMFWPLKTGIGMDVGGGEIGNEDGCALTDPESEYFEAEWDYIPRCAGGPNGVPNNTEELKDHLGTALMECEGARLLREMPEALA